MGRLADKVAFITGAARGQGRSHAVRFAEEGADIIAVDACVDFPTTAYPGATEADLAETVRQVEALDRRIVARKADVRDLDGLRAAVKVGVSEFGRLDVVIANAGIGSSQIQIVPSSPQQWGEVVDINLTGVWHTVKAAVPHIVAGGRGGSVLITGSTAALIGLPNVGAYGTAKHGLVGMARTLAIELGPQSIRVNLVHPGNVDTDMLQHQGNYQLFCPDIENPTREDMAVRALAMNVLPIPWLEPVDISNAMVFLASDEGRYITGVSLPVDAGAAIA